MNPQAEKLRALLKQEICHPMPCCYDGLSAKLIEQSGFAMSFMSGFAVSAARLGLPDTGLISYGEMVDQGRNICAAVSIPIMGDGDTGHGNAANVYRTVEGYSRAGFAAVMIEDQLSPKRCGHTKGKAVVSRELACERIRAAVDAKEANDILLIARTDAKATHGLDEAVERALAFKEMGADILFVEAPETIAEMEIICNEVGGIQMANIIDGGKTPVLPPDVLFDLGFKIAAYPLTLISAAMEAMLTSLAAIQKGVVPGNLLHFEEVRRRIGFEDYYQLLGRYEDH